MLTGGESGAGPLGEHGAGAAARGGDGAVVTLRQLPHEFVGDPEFLRRLRVETPIVANLDGAYIVRTLACVEDPFGLALVMDHVDGVPLRRVIEGGAAATAEVALVVLHDLLCGLEEAHREGILHRDLRPEKVVCDRAGRARITELGVVARTPGGRWIPGTPEYMAPELWGGDEPGIASDIYAAAVLFAECLTGVPPYQGGVVVVRAQHLTAPPPDLGLPHTLARLVVRGMAKSPDERYATAAEFAADVAATGNRLGGLQWETHGRHRLATAVAAALTPASSATDPPRRLIGRSALGRLVRAGLVVVVVGGTVAGATWMLERENGSHATVTSHPSGGSASAQIVGGPQGVPGALTGTAPSATPAPVEGGSGGGR